MGEIAMEVRCLAGESTVISISPSNTIADLKLLLSASFPPASSSSNFHLFLRGTKLAMQCQIGSLSINSGDFIALIPFSKKGKSKNLSPKESAVSSQTSLPTIHSEVAEAAWRGMMEDLSYLNNASNCEQQPESIPDDLSMERKAAMLERHSTSNLSRKRGRMSVPEIKGGFNEELISCILQSSRKHAFDKELCESFLKTLESVHCLLDVETGKCVLLSNTSMQDSSQPSLSCLCPPWLKIMVKGFTFLNILTGFLQVVHEKITFEYIKYSLGQLCKLGFCVSIEDLKRLSDLCPKWRQQFRLMPSSFVTPKEEREIKLEISAWQREGNFNYKNTFSLEQLIAFIQKAELMSHRKAAARDRNSSLSHAVDLRCHETHPLSPWSMLEHLKKGFGSKGQVVHVEEIHARVADFTEIPEELSTKTKFALDALGITKLYSHQAESIRASLCGKNVIVATMISSGKSLCYNVPVLEALSQNILSCALYLFPTKALAQDQLRALLAMTERFKHLNVGVYDGDTCQTQRNWLLDNARLLITNPDMLHLSILPFHGQFQRILSNLKFVVIDEAHVYKGAFGCHTALILRRLQRLCSHVYGSDPAFVFSTATSANPCEHVMELANLPTVELIDKDGSPSGPKLFILWNPPLCNKTVTQAGTKTKIVVSSQSSAIVESSCLFAEFVQHGLRSIAFCKTRKLCELVLSYTREILQDTAPHLVSSICAYRAGYIAKERRRIESEFFSGNLRGVAATNALELGIDVGHIDATLHLGFPGSVASLRQQAGRSGRRGKPSLAVYVAFEGPLDQYFMNNPLKLFGSPMECCHVDSQNPMVLQKHLGCAAMEHPLSLIYDEKYFGSGLISGVAVLESSGYLSSDRSRDSQNRIWNYIGPEKSPSRAISIRAIESEKYKVIDGETNEILEEIEESRAFFQVYEGAVYMNQGQTYLVKELDLSTKIAVCQKADLKYYTKTRDYTDIDVVGGYLAYPPRAPKTEVGTTIAITTSCKVTTTWFGFRRFSKGSNKVLDTVDLVLPKYSYDSQAVWIQVPSSVKLALESRSLSFRAGLHAASHAVLNVVPLYIICDSSDVASECANPYETRHVPERILLYDPLPGGTGISMRNFRGVIADVRRDPSFICNANHVADLVRMNEVYVSGRRENKGLPNVFGSKTGCSGKTMSCFFLLSLKRLDWTLTGFHLPMSVGRNSIVQYFFMDLLIAALDMLTSCHCSIETGCPNCVHNICCQEYNELLHKDAAIMIIKGVLGLNTSPKETKAVE